MAVYSNSRQLTVGSFAVVSSISEPGSLPLSRPAVTKGCDVVRLGFMPLTDCAPLVVAEMLGLFQGHGVRVELSPLNAWVALRDRIAIGQLDGGQMLAPMPIASSLGLGSVARAVSVVSVLTSQGNTITLGDTLLADIEKAAPALAKLRPLPAEALAAAIRMRKRKGQEAPILAIVYPFSSHNYLLRYWLASAGIDPDTDVLLRAVPPPLVADELAEGRIDGFCAGQPWGSRAVDLRAGRIVLGTGDIWPNHPEKVFALSSELLEHAPETAAALVAATIQAGKFLADQANLKQAAKWVHYYALPQVPLSVVEQSLSRRLPYGPDEMEQPFAAPEFCPARSCPHTAHGQWWLRQMQRWGHAGEAPSGLIERLWRTDIWLAGAARAGFPADNLIVSPCPDGA